MATKVPMATKVLWQQKVQRQQKIQLATNIPMATKVIMATKVPTATKVPIATKVPMATKSTIALKAQIAQNLNLAVWLHMKYGLVYEFLCFFVYYLRMEICILIFFLLQVKTSFFHLGQDNIQLKRIVFCIQNIFLIPERIESAKISSAEFLK